MAGYSNIWPHDVFSVKLHGRDPQPPWDSVDWDADVDWEWHSAAEHSPEQRIPSDDAAQRTRPWATESLVARVTAAPGSLTAETARDFAEHARRSTRVAPS